MTLGIFGHSSRSALVRSGTDVGRECLARSLRYNSPKGVLSGWGQDSVQAIQVIPHQTRSSMSLWTLLCALVCCHVGTGRGHPQTVSTKLGAWHCSKSFGMLKHSEFLSLELRGQDQLLKKKQPHTIIPPPPNFTLGTMQSDALFLS